MTADAPDRAAPPRLAANARGPSASGLGRGAGAPSRPNAGGGGEELLFLTDAQLRQGVELMFFAYRDMVADADRLLAARGYGRAHHRCLHFVWRRPGISVTGLLDLLGVTKQSLNRVLRQLVDDGLILSQVGETDRRQRLLMLTAEGDSLVRALSSAQNERMRRVFLEAGPAAVQAFKTVLAGMIDPGARDSALAVVNDRASP